MKSLNVTPHIAAFEKTLGALDIDKVEDITGETDGWDELESAQDLPKEIPAPLRKHLLEIAREQARLADYMGRTIARLAKAAGRVYDRKEAQFEREEALADRESGRKHCSRCGQKLPTAKKRSR